MARETYTTLLNTAKDLISAPSGSLSVSTIENFLILENNKAIRNIKSELETYVVFSDEYTFETEDDVQDYDLPADFNRLVTATLEVGSVKYPLTVINSKERWDQINQIDFSGTTIPQFIFLKTRKFGIYPTPQEDGLDGVLTYIAIEKDLDTADYTTGTVTLVNGDATVTGAGTTFTADFIGRWFRATVDGNWYKIDSYTSATSIELDQDFQGTSGATLAYTIGESPNIPTELHEFIPHRTASAWYSVKKDFNSAQAHLNYFKYGSYNPNSNDMRYPRSGIEGAKKRYARSSTGRMVYRNTSRVSRFDERFSTTLSSTI